MRTAVVLVGVGALASGAAADVIDFGGDVQMLDSPPASVAEGALESDTQVFCFREQSHFTLQNDLTVDITQPGTYSRKRDLSINTISAGTTVDSWLLHFDPADNSASHPYEGFLTFDAPVLGIIVCWKDLAASNTILGGSGTIYTSKRGDGLENNGKDSVTFDALTNTVSFSGQASTAIDHIRIITEAVPNPASLAYLGIGGLLFASKRRQRV